MKREHHIAAGALVLLILGGGAFLWMKMRSPLPGRWVRNEATLCSITYPTQLEFLTDGTYTVQGVSPWWQGGRYTYENGRLRLETTTGRTSYAVTVTGNEVTFTNSTGCAITYRRSR